MKTCTKCKTTKNLTEFHNNRTQPDGHSNHCKLCRNKASAAHWKTMKSDSERYGEYMQHRLKKKTEYRNSHSSELATKQQLRNYRLTIGQFNWLLEKQNFCCASCDAPFGKDHPYRPHVDHDHTCCPKRKTCGKCVRALVCQRCNLAIGFLQNSPIIGLKVVEYMKRYVLSGKYEDFCSTSEYIPDVQ